jgi:hypothetical protein
VRLAELKRTSPGELVSIDLREAVRTAVDRKKAGG